MPQPTRAAQAPAAQAHEDSDKLVRNDSSPAQQATPAGEAPADTPAPSPEIGRRPARGDTARGAGRRPTGQSASRSAFTEREARRDLRLCPVTPDDPPNLSPSLFSRQRRGAAAR